MVGAVAPPRGGRGGDAVSAPLMWCEARCFYFVARDKWGGGACHETAQGAFGVLMASAAARQAGWKVINGEWCCGPCSRALAATNQSAGEGEPPA